LGFYKLNKNLSFVRNSFSKRIDSKYFISHFFFKKDKNHILKESQVQGTFSLCKLLFEKTIGSYDTLFNPLGLEDSTTKNIKGFELKDNSNLEGIYENIAAIYRYRYGDSQLEIIWDGKTHHEKFLEDWSSIYEEWVTDLCQNRTLIKGILHLTVFSEQKKNNFFVENSLKAIINEYFDLKVLTRNGIKKVYVKVPQILKFG
jgi:hypothetical protein